MLMSCYNKEIFRDIKLQEVPTEQKSITSYKCYNILPGQLRIHGSSNNKNQPTYIMKELISKRKERTETFRQIESLGVE